MPFLLPACQLFASAFTDALFPTLLLKNPHMVCVAVQMLLLCHVGPLLSILPVYPDPFLGSDLVCGYCSHCPSHGCSAHCWALTSTSAFSPIEHPCSPPLGSSTMEEKPQCPMGTLSYVCQAAATTSDTILIVPTIFLDCHLPPSLLRKLT